MAEKINLLTVSIKAAGAIGAEKFVDWTGALGVTGVACAGISAAAGATGDQVPVQTDGVAIATSAGAIGANVLVYSDGVGNATATGATGAVALARSIDAATGANQRIRVKLIPN